MAMAEAPALRLGLTRDRVAPSEESLPNLITIGEIVRNNVLPRAERIAQEAPQALRFNYFIPTDRGNVRISVPKDRLDGDISLYYSTKIGKGNSKHDVRVALTLGDGYEFARISDRGSKPPVLYKAPPDELVWLSSVLRKGDIQPAQTTVELSHEVVEEDAPPIGF